MSELKLNSIGEQANGQTLGADVFNVHLFAEI